MTQRVYLASFAVRITVPVLARDGEAAMRAVRPADLAQALEEAGRDELLRLANTARPALARPIRTEDEASAWRGLIAAPGLPAEWRDLTPLEAHQRSRT